MLLPGWAPANGFYMRTSNQNQDRNNEISLLRFYCFIILVWPMNSIYYVYMALTQTVYFICSQFAEPVKERERVRDSTTSSDFIIIL